MSNLKEGDDYYINGNGMLVFTSSYHLRRETCCGSGCLHCPYSYKNVEENRRKILLKERPPVILMSQHKK